MPRIEGEQLRLVIPPSSTVIVVNNRPMETGKPVPAEIPSERWHVGRFVPSTLIRQATQEIMDVGSEDADGRDGKTKLSSAMIKARQRKVSYEDFERFLDQDFHRMNSQMGYDDLRLEEAKETILKEAEIIWTTPEEELPTLEHALKGLSPQKLQ